MKYITIALAKGRLAKQTLALLEQTGITCEEMKDKETRKLIFVNEELGLKFFLSKTSDVPTYVEYGAADIGVVGSDTILEEGRKVLEVLDLGLGKCNMCVAGPANARELLKKNEPEAKEIALAIELFTDGSLNTFAKNTNVDTDNRLICYDILDLGKQLLPIGMLVVLDSILNRITKNRASGRNTFIFIDEIYLLFQHEYSANFLCTLWKRVRK